MGFAAEVNPKPDELSADIVAERMPRELANRFNGAIIRLPELRADDYHRIAMEVENKIPLHMKVPFQRRLRNFSQSHRREKGVRFLEEAMLATLIRLPPTTQEPPSKTLKSFRPISAPTL